MKLTNIIIVLDNLAAEEFITTTADNLGSIRSNFMVNLTYTNMAKQFESI